jgi:GT2 family glycosyltransferase
VKDEISLIIKTFERPPVLERLLVSILASPAADLPILVADDSRRPGGIDLPGRGDIRYFELPYDAGLACGRNFLIDRVSTPYCVLLDDDFLFLPGTRLEILLDLVRNRGFDLAGGAIEGLVHGRPGYGNIELADGALAIRPGAPPRAHVNGLPVYDMVSNFFLAKTDTLRAVRWDERFKIYGEHTDFFLRYSRVYKVTFTGEVVIGHQDAGYSLRGLLGKYAPGRGYRSLRILGQKHGARRFAGREIFGLRGLLNFYLPGIRNLAGHLGRFAADALRGRSRDNPAGG